METLRTPNDQSAQDWMRITTTWFNRIDPVYRLLRGAFAIFFRPTTLGGYSDSALVEIAERQFLFDNLRKHRLIAWINLVALGALISARPWNFSWPYTTVLLAGLLAPAVIAGTAWYNISFTGIPEKFVDAAMLVTGFLFAAFSLSLTAVVALLASLIPWPILIVIVIPIYASLYSAAVFYDNLDGLKAAAVQVLSPTSRALQKYAAANPTALSVPPSTGAIGTRSNPRESSGDGIFNHLCFMVDSNLVALAEEKPPSIANHLVVNSLDLLVRIISLTKGRVEFDADYAGLLTRATEMTVDEVNDRTAGYLRVVAEALHGLLGSRVAGEIADLEAQLGAVERLRQDLGSLSEDEGGRQKLADFLFVQVFRALVSIVTSHREILLQEQT